MNCENSILIRAPLENIFAVTSNLESWPTILPHYRWIRVLDRNGSAMTVNMAARRGLPRPFSRGWLPIQWTSRYEADADVHELRFHHLKAFTKGMDVKWTYTPTPEGVLVRISHQLNRQSAFGRWFAHRILGELFIKPVAAQTLKHFRRHLESSGVEAAVPSGRPSCAAEDGRRSTERSR